VCGVPSIRLPREEQNRGTIKLVDAPRRLLANAICYERYL